MIKLKHIDKGKAFDWGRTSTEYGKFRDIYPEEFYQKLLELKLGTKGQKVLDLGTGTGVLPRNMYRFGAHFIGADIAENQIKEAIKLSKENNMDIDYLVAPAEEINFPDNSFDVIQACQCFMYFEKKILLPNIKRMLKPGGVFATLFMAWLPGESQIAQKSEDLVLKYNPEWTGKGYKRFELKTPEWSRELFTVKHKVTFDVNLKFTRESWHGRIVACRGIGASSLNKKEIAAFEKEHIEMLNTSTPEEFEIPHYVSMLVFEVK